MFKEFVKLYIIIKYHSLLKEIYYIPNPGNWGDALIRYGTLKFFNKYKIIFNEINTINNNWIDVYEHNIKTNIVKSKILIYGGGGSWCKLWHHGPDILLKLCKYFPKIIVLPSSYEINYAIKNTIFFSRDYFDSKIINAKSIFCHDMAFFIGKINRPRGTGTGYFFRTDLEGLNRGYNLQHNSDISAHGNHLTGIHLFFDEISKYAVIHTDRLHVAIATCLLDRELHLYPGSYFKNEAVFKSSIKNYFQNVFFHK